MSVWKQEMKRLLIPSLFIFLPHLGLAESVTTTDGRHIILNNDGTYVEIAPTSNESDRYVELLDPFFERHVSKYQQQSVRFIPKFQNISDHAIFGIKFTSTFRDAFNEDIFIFNGAVNERIEPGSKSTADVFYVFENNQFLGGQPYDKLLPMIVGDTGSVHTVVSLIALDGGVVLNFTRKGDP